MFGHLGNNGLTDGIYLGYTPIVMFGHFELTVINGHTEHYQMRMVARVEVGAGVKALASSRG